MRQHLTDPLRFFAAFVAHPRQMGAVLPTSRTAQRDVGSTAPTWRGLVTKARRKRSRSVRWEIIDVLPGRPGNDDRRCAPCHGPGAAANRAARDAGRRRVWQGRGHACMAGPRAR